MARGSGPGPARGRAAGERRQRGEERSGSADDGGRRRRASPMVRRTCSGFRPSRRMTTCTSGSRVISASDGSTPAPAYWRAAGRGAAPSDPPDPEEPPRRGVPALIPAAQAGGPAETGSGRAAVRSGQARPQAGVEARTVHTTSAVARPCRPAWHPWHHPSRHKPPRPRRPPEAAATAWTVPLLGKRNAAGTGRAPRTGRGRRGGGGLPAAARGLPAADTRPP